LLRLQAQLNKTIVFITHDLDEAIKIADRIAIMDQGRIVQIGTPEDLIMRPANEYVARFTKGVPKSKVVKVSTIMKPVAGNIAKTS
jgi:glycine betaine/proline transport system ATP-binding protein